MATFTKKIKCIHCDGFFKRRRNNKADCFWICSRRENGYTICPRVQIQEKFLISVIQKRYLIRWGREIEENEMSDKIEYIYVQNQLLFNIKLIDFEDEIVYGKSKILF